MRFLTASLVLLACTAVFAQELQPSFDAASIKPADVPVGPFVPGSRLVCPVTGCGGPGTGSPERITFAHASLKNLIKVAYNLWSPNQIEAPAWMESATFDVVANIRPGATRDQANLMLQRLLTDRFELAVHRSTRELPIYALVVAKNGPKLKVSVADPNAPKPRGTLWAGGRKSFEFDSWTMASFASALESDVDRPVIDATGLEGTYDIHLEFSATGPVFGSPAPDPQASELFTALTEQLGLRLESKKGPVVVLVVDGALRRPSDN